MLKQHSRRTNRSEPISNRVVRGEFLSGKQMIFPFGLKSERKEKKRKGGTITEREKKKEKRRREYDQRKKLALLLRNGGGGGGYALILTHWRTR